MIEYFFTRMPPHHSFENGAQKSTITSGFVLGAQSNGINDVTE